MRRQLALLSYAAAALGRHRLRTFAIGLGLVCIAAYVAVVLMLVDSLRAEYTSGVDALPDLTVQRLVAGRPALIDADRIDLVRGLRGVARVEARVWGYLFFPTLSGNLTVVGADLGDSTVREDLGLLLADGRAPRPPKKNEEIAGPHDDTLYEAAVGLSLAQLIGLEVEDGISLTVAGQQTHLDIVGMFDAQSAIYDGDVIFTDKAAAHRLLNVPETQAVDLAIWLHTPDESTVMARKLAETFDDARIIDRTLLARAYDLTFNTRGGTVAALLFPAVLAFLLLAWERLTSVSARTRREIGVLKAIGWETTDILTTRLWESGLLALVATAVGVIFAYFFVFVAGAPLVWDAIVGWSSAYPAMTLTPTVGVSQLLGLVSLLVVPYVAVSLIPAWRAATLPASVAVRGVG